MDCMDMEFEKQDMPMKKTTIILASASPRRRELLGQVGIIPEVLPSHVEEVVTSTKPDHVVMELSAQKAEDVAAMYYDRATVTGPDVVIIGSDTVVAVDGEILGKPRDAEDAVRMITMIQGRTHQVYTGVTMIFGRTGECVTFAEKTDVHVYPMTEEQIRRYVDTKDPMDKADSRIWDTNTGRLEWEDKAGGYAIQGYFARFIKKIDGDYYNVVGLPVGRVCQELMKVGIL